MPKLNIGPTWQESLLGWDARLVAEIAGVGAGLDLVGLRTFLGLLGSELDSRHRRIVDLERAAAPVGLLGGGELSEETIERLKLEFGQHLDQGTIIEAAKADAQSFVAPTFTPLIPPACMGCGLNGCCPHEWKGWGFDPSHPINTEIPTDCPLDGEPDDGGRDD